MNFRLKISFRPKSRCLDQNSILANNSRSKFKFRSENAFENHVCTVDQNMS